ncbi:DNA polymerase [Bradyrhizobium sp. McL0616]|uniref:DNA polymerase n=1 Tax=Bradyrhizobium sp. McL0616 TaxID=3415674 RepID=UPI003CEF934A
MIATELPFKEIWLADFEYVSKSGEPPDVLCLCAKELRTGQTFRLWRDEQSNALGPLPPYSVGSDTLFICFVANAECLCHLTLGWPLPRNILDLYPIFRAYLNGLTPPAEGKGLVGALSHFGLSTIGGRRKDAMRNRILQGHPFSHDEQIQVLDYCMSDVAALEQLMMKLLSGVELDVALHWGEFAAVSAAMEHRGVPIDMEIFSQLQDKAVWAFARDALVPKIDAQYGVYVKGQDDDWHFNVAGFEDYLERAGIDWPRDEVSGKLNLRRRTFDGMAKAWPELEALRQLRYARDKMRKIKLAVGADGRNRTVLWPFASKTSRTQPKAAQWIFSPAVWLRSLIKPERGRAIAYIDWSSMEFQIAAALSKCEPMLELYASGSPYLEFAKRFDEAPLEATKKTHAHVHERYKIGCLGAQYGMQTETLAMRLGLSTFVAHEMLSQHRGLFNAYWQWVDDWTARALDTGVMRTASGWTCRTGITEFNARSIGNWPVQSTGADILRLACVWAHRRGIRLCGPIHDAALIEAPIEHIEADVALMQEIMRRASRVMLGGGHELRTDATIVRYPGRYTDKRGEKIWQDVLGLLAQYRQQRERADA